MEIHAFLKKMYVVYCTYQTQYMMLKDVAPTYFGTSVSSSGNTKCQF